LAKRAEILLAATSTKINSKISEQVGIDRKQVKVWRERWINFAPKLFNAEEDGVEDNKLQEMIIELLSDKSRPGMPNVFSEEQVSQILALAKESSGHQEITELPEYRENKQVADEAVRLGIVPNISPRSVGRFLKRRNAIAV
jgi:putative transposase